jgi:predicted nucleotidyltransferase component of viral defense system
MITWEELKNHYSGSIEGQEKNILREYLQYKILDIIFRHQASLKLSFLGGTAIKICYNSARFSEDLDFDNFDLSQEEFQELAEAVEREISLLGYGAETKTVFKGAFRCYIKIPRLLFDKQLSPLAGEKLVIQIDTASHGFDYTPRDHLLQKFDVFTNIKLTQADILLSQKAETILSRKRAKGRDLYDLVYLKGITDFNWEYLEYKTGIKTEEQLKQKLLQRVEEMDLEDLARDVRYFLINPKDEERILYFPQYIRQEL